MVVGLLGNESAYSNRLILVYPKPENGVRIQAKLGSKNPMGLLVGVVRYWHWHSIHNSFETYWKGILSHDFAENAVYREACIIGNELSKAGKHLVNLKKRNKVVILVSHDTQPHILNNCFGIKYNQFTLPEDVWLLGEIVSGFEDAKAETFMELIIPETAEVLMSYDHYAWSDYAAVTKNSYGNGNAMYIGCMFDESILKKLFKEFFEEIGVMVSDVQFPVIIRKGVNDFAKEVTYYLNYSADTQNVEYKGKDGVELLSGNDVAHSDNIEIKAWNLCIIEGE